MGVPYRVLEQRNELSREGAAIALWGNAMKALEQIGAPPTLMCTVMYSPLQSSPRSGVRCRGWPLVLTRGCPVSCTAKMQQDALQGHACCATVPHASRRCAWYVCTCKRSLWLAKCATACAGVADQIRSEFTPLDTVRLCRDNGQVLKQFGLDECTGGVPELIGVSRQRLQVRRAAQPVGRDKFGVLRQLPAAVHAQCPPATRPTVLTYPHTLADGGSSHSSPYSTRGTVSAVQQTRLEVYTTAVLW